MARTKPIPQHLPEGPVLVDPDLPAAEPPKPQLQTRYTRAPGPKTARRYTRQRLAEALPLIADTLIGKAIAGGLPELKLLIQLAGLDDKEPPPDPANRKFGGRYFEDILIEEWRKERDLDSAGLETAPEPHPGNQPVAP